MRSLPFPLFFFLSCQVFAQPAKTVVQITDLLKIKTVSTLMANAAGTEALFTVVSIEPDEKAPKDYKYISQVYRLPLSANASPIQLTYSKEGASSPAWSPDGKQLVFVRTTDGKPQLFVMSATGGEAWPLTRFAYGASQPRWSPDGRWIYFTASVPYNSLLKDSALNATRGLPLWPSEKPGISQAEISASALAKPDADGNLAQLRAYLSADESDGKAIVLNKLNFQDESSVTAAQSFTQIYRVALMGGSQPQAITHGFYRYSAPEITPDGRQIIYSAGIDSTQNPDRLRDGGIYIANGDGTAQRLLLGEKNTTYDTPKLSPSGKWLAFQYGSADADVTQIGVLSLTDNNSPIKTITLDRSKSNITWRSDEKSLYFTAQSNGGVPLYKANIATGQADAVTDFSGGISSYLITSSNVFYTKTAVTDPSELYVADGKGRAEKQLTRFNDWVATKQLSYPEKKTFAAANGSTIEYWVMKPANYEAGKKYPLILEIHGGPSAMWGPGEASMWHEFQAFCGKGFGVVYSNPRGSGGYGDAFIKANMLDWGAGPAQDVLTALDKTVAEGWADTGKLFVTGGSYGGYLVAWIVGHDKRFKAACSQRGVYDLATFFGEGNAWRLVPKYFDGYPWEPQVKALLQRESPITYVQNITTPYIIFHGDNDRRTGFVQGEMMYRSLKVLNRPVEYVRHPGGTHELTRSGDNRQRIDQLLRTYEFFSRYAH